MPDKLTKIETQTYRIATYIIFKMECGDWKMGRPVDWAEPIGAGLIAGSVSYHRTLRDAKNRFYRERRELRRLSEKHGVDIFDYLKGEQK